MSVLSGTLQPSLSARDEFPAGQPYARFMQLKDRDGTPIDASAYPEVHIAAEGSANTKADPSQVRAAWSDPCGGAAEGVVSIIAAENVLEIDRAPDELHLNWIQFSVAVAPAGGIKRIVAVWRLRVSDSAFQ